MNTPTATIQPEQKKRRIASQLSLGELLQMKMSQHRINAEELARRSRTAPSVISRVLNGKQVTVMPEVAERLMRALTIDLATIYKAMRNGKARRRLDVSKSENTSAE